MLANKRFTSIENIIFWVIIILNLIPIFSGKFLPTMDGAAHLNNVSLIKELLFHPNSVLHNYYTFNPEPVPNWIGHFILLFFRLFLPSFLAEKALLILYFVGLPFVFRLLIKTISPNNIIYSYFIFPFTYSSVFLLGFYNFSFAIIFYLIALIFWFKNSQNLNSVRNFTTFSLLIIATYFSHIFMFSLLLFSIGLHVLFVAIKDLIESTNNFKLIAQSFGKKAFIILLSSLIPLILFTYYVITRSALQVKIYLPTSELITWIKTLRPIIAYNPPFEEAFTTKIFYVLALLFGISIYLKIDNIVNSKDEISEKRMVLKNLFTQGDFWLMCSGFVLILYFIMPDADDSGGFFSIRLALVFFILLILYLSTQKIATWFSVFSVVVVLGLNFKLNSFYFTSIKDLDKQAQECLQASEFIEPNSVVLPIDFSNHWLQGHFSNYLGADKPMVILENYECTKGYFPLLWNEEKFPKFLLDGKSPDDIECLWWKSTLDHEAKSINYVFVLGNINTIEDNCFKQTILYKFEKVFQGNGCALFKVN